MMSIGLAGLLFLGKHSQTIFGVGFDIHSLVYMAALVVTGVQLLSFSILARALGKYLNLLPSQKPPGFMASLISIDRALVVGVLVFFLGLVFVTSSIGAWSDAGFGSLDPRTSMRTVVPSVTLMITGIQVFFSAFFYGLIESFVISKKAC